MESSGTLPPREIWVNLPGEVFNHIMIIGGPTRPHGWITTFVNTAIDHYIKELEGARALPNGEDPYTWLQGLTIGNRKKGRKVKSA